VIFPDFWENFEGQDMKSLEGKRIRVFGRIAIYQQKYLQIHLHKPTQIEVLE
jgi:hypothetical protein